jgi:hypothetical protein
VASLALKEIICLLSIRMYRRWSLAAVRKREEEEDLIVQIDVPLVGMIHS